MRILSRALAALVSAAWIISAADGVAQVPSAPTPLVAAQHPVLWWLAFKFNAASFPSSPSSDDRSCAFGGSPQAYSHFSQRFIVASNEQPQLQDGQGLLGTSDQDPVGATFGQIYQGTYYYVVWNDQLYDAPKIQGCSKECGGPWGHSKGMLAWDDAGDGVILQVTTPSWPAAGSAGTPRQGDGNTLGCVSDNDVLVSQDFFSLQLTESDVAAVLRALANASVVTDPTNPQLVHNGGPAELQALVTSLGTQSNSASPSLETLSSGVQLISKPSALHVPPWQMVSALLGGVPLRVASWWTRPTIAPTDASSQIACWDPSLGAPGAVAIGKSGAWEGTTFRLTGGLGPNFNHAKIGVSTDPAHPYSIFGDMNQQGALSGKCASSQNGRGGLFFVVSDPSLNASLSSLLSN